MEFLDRGRVDEPKWLVENAEQWGREWAEKLEVDRQSRFIWHQCDGYGHADLVERLGVLTDRHCSYCDAFPMGPRMQSTIDHFRPKVSFPNDAYRWENIFLSCSLCQKKQFDEQLLKPDVRSYDFDKYFEIDYETGEVKPRGGIGPEDHARAEITVKRLGLNVNGKPEDRLQELDHYESACRGGGADLNEWSYRFLLRRATGSPSNTGPET